MPIDVPAYTHYDHYVENHVQVQAGNNWDFSRTARVTPIALSPDPEAVVLPVESSAPSFTAHDEMPAPKALAVVKFLHEGITIDRDAQKLLLSLPKDTELIVAAHGDRSESDANRLARVRAKAVTTFLRGKGYTIRIAKAYGSARPISETEPAENRVVAIYAAEEMASSL